MRPRLTALLRSIQGPPSVVLFAYESRTHLLELCKIFLLHETRRRFVPLERSLGVIGQPDVVEFKRRHYTPGQLLVIGVGNLTMSQLESLIGNVLGDWAESASHLPVEVPSVPPVRPGVLVVDRPGAVQSEIRVGRIGIRRNSPDYHAALIMNRILGGQFSSRLNANLREKPGLTYGAWSAFQAFRWEGPFVAGGAFHAEKTDEAVRELIGELERMRESGITEEEHGFAVESLAGAYALAFETSGQVALALQVRELYDMPPDSFATYLARLRAVTFNASRARSLSPQR